MGRGPFDWNEDIQRLGPRFDDYFDRVLGLASAPRYLLQQTWRPAVDVYEIEGGLLVIAEIPGVDEADMQVTIDNGRLRIAGTRRSPHAEESSQPLQLEIDDGPFERLIALPGDIDADGIRAEFRHGMLAVRIPGRRVKRTIRVQGSESDET